MADRDRPTKRERREEARRERREKEAAAAAAARRRRITNSLVALAVVGAVVAVIVTTAGGEDAPTGITVDRAAAEEAFAAAGCEVVEIPELSPFSHLAEPAPPATQLYPVRPTDNGPHLAQPAPPGAFDDPVDERNTTHSLEHGSVIAWWTPQGEDASSEVLDWVGARNDAGFVAPAPGAGIIGAPFSDGTSTGKPFALRAWFNSWDCDRWDQTVADSFLIQFFGTHGQAPEGNFAPFPEDVLSFTGDAPASPAPTAGGETPATSPATETTGTEPAGSPSPAPS